MHLRTVEISNKSSIYMTKAKKKQPRRQKHVPQRTCVVCRDKKDKRELLRIVNNPEDGIVIDLTGKKNGRGAYVCTQTACWDKVEKSNILGGALRTTVESETKQMLHNRFKEIIEEMGSTA